MLDSVPTIISIKHSITAPVDEVKDPFLQQAGITLSVLRCDLVHPLISGNKWFKLKYNLEAAREQGIKRLLSFGGPWSNHLHALAAAGKQFGFDTVGLVRGELEQTLTPCLQDCVDNGMQIVGISRSEYRQKHEPAFIAKLVEKYGKCFVIPEGGANAYGIKGSAEIADLISMENFDHLAISCGTGTTMTGLVTASTIPVIGFQALKSDGYLAREIQNTLAEYHLKARCNWSVMDQFHFGGFAKTSDELLTFIEDFKSINSIPLEPVYSGKMMCGLYHLSRQGYFPADSRILAIHGGGLQGARGFGSS